MAFKIKSADQKRIAEALELLAAQRAAVEEAITVFNEELSAARGKLEVATEAHNEQAEAVRAMIEDIHREMDDEFGGKSDKWQDGDKAGDIRSWLDDVERLGQDVEDIDLSGVAEDLESDDILPSDPQELYDNLEKEPQV